MTTPFEIPLRFVGPGLEALAQAHNMQQQLPNSVTGMASQLGFDRLVSHRQL